LYSCLVIPFEVDSITRWVGDPNIVPIIAITTVDVAIFLESKGSNFRDCFFNAIASFYDTRYWISKNSVIASNRSRIISPLGNICCSFV
jgi:hypothetical protein